MFKFFTESIKEFEHVVWPTKNETRKYFSIVVGLIISLTLFIFVIGSAFSAGLFYAKNIINPAKISTTSQTPNTSKSTDNNLKLDDIKINSGSVSTGSVNTK
ncbi:MAG: preprotein translocase subunit SecE [Candidatus Gracilibacteria bacterium]|nr:preprotein translocase subunit SecE [Candidatus Gracilibacteria bacterium]